MSVHEGNIMDKNIKSENNISGHICEYCDKIFYSSLAYEEHVEKIHEIMDDEISENFQTEISNVLKCEYCEETFESTEIYHEHIERVHESVSDDCDDDE